MLQIAVATGRPVDRVWDSGREPCHRRPPACVLTGFSFAGYDSAHIGLDRGKTYSFVKSFTQLRHFFSQTLLSENQR
jgi:hypothetical protein